jgi:hypothetical protein
LLVTRLDHTNPNLTVTVINVDEPGKGRIANTKTVGFQELHAVSQTAWKRALEETEHRAGMKKGGLTLSDYLALGCDLRFLSRMHEFLDADGQSRVKFAVLDAYVAYHITAARTEFPKTGRYKRNGGLLPSEDEILGLVGELLLLRRLVSASPNLWQGWNGPLGSARDYSWGVVDIEAKASRMAGESRLTVNGLDQLEPEEDRELLIHHSILTDNPVGTIDVPSLVDEIRGQISDPEGFDTRLASAKYLSEQRDLWLEHRFTLHGSHIYRVSEDFPRIRKSDFPDGTLPAGVSKLRYDVLLANCSDFRLSTSEEESLFTAVAQSVDTP